MGSANSQRITAASGCFSSHKGQELRILGVVIAMVRALYPVAGYRPPTGAWS